jgi:hypothetical protein
VDFALVGGLLTVLFASLLQLGLVLHVRSTLTDCAAESARFAARADRAPDDGAARARSLVADELSSGYAGRLTEVSASSVELGGMQVVEVTLSAPVPLLGLVGLPGGVTVHGHAVRERQPEP